MADTKISDLTDGSALRSADALVIARAGANHKVVASALDWISDEADTWTYASADAPTFTFTVSGDKTSELTVGKRIKLTQTTVKYFIVTACSYSAGTTTVTVYGGTDYVLASAAISANFHSGLKAPAGFPLNPDKWTVTVTDVTVRTKSSPAANTWYQPTSGTTIDIPIGLWVVYWRSGWSASANANLLITLSTTTNSETDTDFTFSGGYSTAVATGSMNETHAIVVAAAKTTHYLLIRTSTGSLSSISYANTFIRAVCAYL